MARKKTQIIFKLLSTAGTNYCYYGTKHVTKNLNKLSTLKFDPVVNCYTVFNQTKLASGRKKR